MLDRLLLPFSTMSVEQAASASATASHGQRSRSQRGRATATYSAASGPNRTAVGWVPNASPQPRPPQTSPRGRPDATARWVSQSASVVSSGVTQLDQAMWLLTAMCTGDRARNSAASVPTHRPPKPRPRR